VGGRCRSGFTFRWLDRPPPAGTFPLDILIQPGNFSRPGSSYTGDLYKHSHEVLVVDECYGDVIVVYVWSVNLISVLIVNKKKL
jgi:hypothetical protein